MRRSKKQRSKKQPGKKQLDGVTLIGLGNWGTSLASALHAAGVSLPEIVVRAAGLVDPSTQKLAQKLGARLVTWNETKTSARKKSATHNTSAKQTAQLDAEVFWICTPDAAIAATARALARQGLQHPRPIVLHSSGALSSAELAAVRTAAASVASVHPLMTFPNKKITSLAGVPFAIEGDARAVQMARRLVRQMGAEPFSLRSERAEQKAMYHAYATFTSPLLTALLAATQAAGRAAGFSAKDARRRMQQIVERTVANFFSQDAAQAFSGPVARGDVETVARHLAILASQSELQEIYRALQLFAVANLPGKHKPALRNALKRNNSLDSLR
jgi:predicted short-subunit dehydrogenase-like oxidoreductase (DUF2520 family)